MILVQRRKLMFLLREFFVMLQWEVWVFICFSSPNLDYAVS